MSKKKIFYWIKLKNNFFESDEIDYLMSQVNGSSYVMLYEMLCLKAVNKNGALASSINNCLVPFDFEKIKRDCKYFDSDTIKVAFALFKQLGLIYYQEDSSIYVIKNFNMLVGTETNWSLQKNLARKKIKASPNFAKEIVSSDTSKSKKLENVSVKEIEDLL